MDSTIRNELKINLYEKDAVNIFRWPVSAFAKVESRRHAAPVTSHANFAMLQNIRYISNVTFQIEKKKKEEKTTRNLIRFEWFVSSENDD